MQFDGNLARGHAECLALIDVLHRNPAVLSGIFVLEVELDGATQWVVTTNLHRAAIYRTWGWLPPSPPRRV